MRTLLVCALLIVLCHSPVWSDDDAELQKAKAAYAEAASKQTELMKAALEREVTKISRTGKLKLVQEIQQEQADFVDKGKLPESAAMKGAVLKYKKALDTARERLESVYDRKIAALTKSERIDEAAAVQSEKTAYLKALADGRDPGEPPPVNEPLAEDSPAADDQQAISLVKAIWKYDQTDGLNDDPGPFQVDVTAKVRSSLFRTGRLKINTDTLGMLDGKLHVKALYLQLMIFRVPVFVHLEENSVITFGGLTPDDAAKRGTRMGNTRLELYEVLWETTAGRELVDVTKEIIPLLQKGPVSVKPPVFPDLVPETPKCARFRFRAGPQTVEFAATEHSSVVFPMNASVRYQNPVDYPSFSDAAGNRPGDEPSVPDVLADNIPLKVGLKNAQWVLTNGKDSIDVSQLAPALLNSRKTFTCDTETFGKINQVKGARVFVCELVVNQARFQLALTEGSKIAILNATAEQLEKTGEPLGGTPVSIIEVNWSTSSGEKGLVKTEMLAALLNGPCRIAPPIFDDPDHPNEVHLALIFLRVGKRILKISAMTGSTIELLRE